MKTYTLTGEKKLPESEMEINAEISYETLAPHRTAAIKKISGSISIPGFRPGHIPEKILIQKVGELAILEEAAYAVIETALPEILTEKKISIVGEPRVSITKLAANNPLAFSIIVSVTPEVKLPDYKKIASAEAGKKTEEISVSEKEVDNFIDNVRKSYATQTAPNSGNSGENMAVKNETEDTKKNDLPELTDEFVKKLGDFKNVSDFKMKILENLQQEKKHKALEKKRLEIAEAVLAKTEVIVPKALIESEIAKMFARFHDDITRMGMKVEDYLKHVKKTEEDIRKEWRPDALKRGKLQLVWSAIAEKEKIAATEQATDEEVKHILEHHADADPTRARAYITMMLNNEKVFEFLESQK
jgi:trigger factor